MVSAGDLDVFLSRRWYPGGTDFVRRVATTQGTVSVDTVTTFLPAHFNVVNLVLRYTIPVFLI